MKKIFSFLLMSAMLLAVGASVASCSSDDEGDGIISEKRVERYVTGYKWYLDGKKKNRVSILPQSVGVVHERQRFGCIGSAHLCRI